MTAIIDIDEIFENIKPLNLGRRLVFQKYCENLVENKQIEQSYVDKYLTKEFLYEDYENLYDIHKRSIDLFNERMDGYIRDQKDLKETFEKEREIRLTNFEEKFEGKIFLIEAIEEEFKGKLYGCEFFLKSIVFDAVIIYGVYKLSKRFL